MRRIIEGLGSLLLMVVSMLVVGTVVRYGWNVFIAPTFMIPHISLPIAIGLDTTITYITGYSYSLGVEDVFKELNSLSKVIYVFLHGVSLSLFTFIIMYVVAQFL